MTDLTKSDRLRRSQMERGSLDLLYALKREHPRIIAHLLRQQAPKRRPGTPTNY